MTWCPNGNELDQDIFDALTQFVTQLLERGDALAQRFGVPPFCIKALHRLDGPVTLKELGKRMHVDPSFVTVIADTLEQRGLARREANPSDRRIKNLVLTPAGTELKARVERALLGQMPWSAALDVTEQRSLLSMVRKMNDALAGSAAPAKPATPAEPGTPAEAEGAGEVTGTPAVR